MKIKIATIKDIKAAAELHRKGYKLQGEALTAHHDECGQFYATAFASRVDISQALQDANGRASAHTINSAADVWAYASDAEKRLADAGVTVANRPGTVVKIQSEVPTSKAYARSAGRAIATQLVLTRTTSAWMLTSVEKIERYTGPGGGEKITTTISEAAKADIVKNAMDGFAVAKPAATTLEVAANV